VALAVIQCLEVVDIDERERELAAGSMRPFDLA
jgi:hypothetical protein